ncbi:hypothetical protein DIPPA_05491 [Diplonema papillatum]|nr:hypothetical protein DIPPA_05491 [Diplonema papillatum]
MATKHQLCICVEDSRCWIEVLDDFTLSDIIEATGRRTGLDTSEFDLTHNGIVITPLDVPASRWGIDENALLVLSVTSQKSFRISRCCCENSFDNVRVSRGYATLRCRACDSKMRVPEERVKFWRCRTFWTTGNCACEADCANIHVHTKKQSSQERLKLRAMQQQEEERQRAEEAEMHAAFDLSYHASSDEENAGSSSDGERSSNYSRTSSSDFDFTPLRVARLESLVTDHLQPPQPTFDLSQAPFFVETITTQWC